ncbi:MAG: hypothetical protein JNL74_19050 [Fibrobacteres bacterium]|nr:hypothetical protein [Fibrobacterota bacterium]
MLRNRRTMRLSRQDYTQGVYFVTICIGRTGQFLAVRPKPTLRQTAIGKIVEETWARIPLHFDNVILDEFVVMPDHVHGILVLGERYKELVAGLWAGREGRLSLREQLAPWARRGEPVACAAPSAAAAPPPLLQGEHLSAMAEHSPMEHQPIAMAELSTMQQQPIAMAELSPRARHGDPVACSAPLVAAAPLAYGCIPGSNWQSDGKRKLHKYQKTVPQSLGVIINHFKGAVKRWCNKNGYEDFRWHRNYHEIGIIGDISLDRVRLYIRNNPAVYEKRMANLSLNLLA